MEVFSLQLADWLWCDKLLLSLLSVEGTLRDSSAILQFSALVRMVPSYSKVCRRWVRWAETLSVTAEESLLAWIEIAEPYFSETCSLKEIHWSLCCIVEVHRNKVYALASEVRRKWTCREALVLNKRHYFKVLQISVFLPSGEPLNCLSAIKSHSVIRLAFDTSLKLALMEPNAWLTGRKMLLPSSGRDSFVCSQMSDLSDIAGRDRLCKAKAVRLKNNGVDTTVSWRGEKLTRPYVFGFYCLPSTSSQGICMCQILNTEVIFQVCLFSLCLSRTAEKNWQ